MVRAVGKGAMDQAQYEVVELEARRVKIAEGRVCVPLYFLTECRSPFERVRLTGVRLTRSCPVCHKRLGTSVIAIHNPRCALLLSCGKRDETL